MPRKRPPYLIKTVERWRGIDLAGAPQTAQESFALVDQNGDHSRAGAWIVRGGLAASGMVTGNSALTCLGWLRGLTGMLVVSVDADGKVFGQAAPTPVWTGG